jgi:hypothetical protein
MQRSLAILALLLAGAGARAAPVPIGWTEHWAALTPQLYAEGSHGGNSHYVSFTTDWGQTLESNPGVPTQVVAARLTAVSSAPSRSRADHISADYTLSLLLEDEASNWTWKTVLFHGQLNGTIWRGGSSLTTRFLSPNLRTFSLGANFYAAVLSYMAPVRGAPNQYTIVSYIAVVPRRRSAQPAVAATPLEEPLPAGGPAASPAASPEPSTLVLSLLGLSALGGGAWWQRGRRCAAAAGA